MKIAKDRNILVFFLAYLLSAFGYEFIFFIMTLHTYDLNKSALNIGIFTALTFIPRLFSSIMGGAADKIGKRKCFIFSAFMVSMLLFLMSSVNKINSFYLIWFIISIFLTFIINVRSAIMAEIISSEYYTSANALALSVLNGAKIIGPLCGGFIVMLCKTKPLLYFTCLIYILAALLGILIKLTRESSGDNGNFLDNARKGFRFMVENRVFGMLTSIAFCWRLFLGLQLSLFVIYVKTCLGGTSEQYGVFIAIMGIGSIIGSIIGPYAAKKLNSRWLITTGLSLHYISFMVLGFCKNYYLSLFVIFTGYLIFYLTLVGIHSIRDRITRFDIRSSSYGTVTALLTPPAILSMLAGGYLANRFGPSIVLFGAGLLALLSLHVLLFWGRNVMRSQKSDPINRVNKGV